MGEPGAFRAVSSRDVIDGDLVIGIDLVWCPRAQPGCVTCLDWQEILGPESGDGDEIDCPDCIGLDVPEWDVARDGPREVTRG